MIGSPAIFGASPFEVPIPIIMSTAPSPGAMFPTLPGLGWSIKKTPRFATRIRRGISGREVRIADHPYPIWTFTLTYQILRDLHNDDEFRILAGFFLRQQGIFQTFLLDDPTDDLTAGQLIGTGNGTTKAFKLIRTFGGYVEPVSASQGVSAIYFDGVAQALGDFSVDTTTGTVTFWTPPPNGKVITADFGYLFRVRFADDAAEFENFMYQLWTLKQIKLQSVLA